MLVIKCSRCGKSVVWDDFQPTEIRCSKCGEYLNVHREFKKNIELRDQTGKGKIVYCPRCRGIVRRRWFIQCPHCGYWLIGPLSFHGKWPFVIIVAIAYLIFAALYALYLR
jgi:DNA-directed RNA polymerase subunit RPC12/RpoP